MAAQQEQDRRGGGDRSTDGEDQRENGAEQFSSKDGGREGKGKEREREKRKTRERRFFNFAGGDIAEAGDILQRDEFGGRVGGTGRERGQIASTRGHAYGSDQKSKHQEEVLHPGVRLGGERGRL